ncbi:MAG: twitching motility protein PilT, partial [gamma proteobacterium symbiont of Stewartia floridana]
GQRLPAVEILLLTTYISELIQKGDIHTIKEVMEQGNERGMQTFDQSLYKLYQEGKITLEEALAHADSRNNLSLKIRLSDTDGVAAPGGLGVAEDQF